MNNAWGNLSGHDIDSHVCWSHNALRPCVASEELSCSLNSNSSCKEKCECPGFIGQFATHIQEHAVVTPYVSGVWKTAGEPVLTTFSPPRAQDDMEDVR